MIDPDKIQELSPEAREAWTRMSQIWASADDKRALIASFGLPSSEYFITIVIEQMVANAQAFIPEHGMLGGTQMATIETVLMYMLFVREYEKGTA